MRFDGTLAKWTDDRGFGFIVPTQGGAEIFVHVSAFPNDGQRPRLNEPLSFEVELNKDGKKRAFAVRRPVSGRAAPAARKHHRRSSHGLRTLVVLLVLCAVAGYGYRQFVRGANVDAFAGQSPARLLTAPSPATATMSACDGRTYCSQMTSCTEAKFFLKNCPGVQMDGNHDGVPCEQQWCTSPFAK